MEGRGQEFKVIDLRRLDPTQALVTINKFFGVTENGGMGPTVDGDPATGKLWVRGTAEQIALVERLLSELEGSDALGQLGDKVRILPYTGSDAQQALQQVQQVWSITGRKNQIRTIAPATKKQKDSGIPERRIPRPSASDRGAGDRGAAPAIPGLAPEATEALLKRPDRFQFVSTPVDPPDPQSSGDDQDSKDEDQDEREPGEREQQKAATTISVNGADIVIQFTPSGMMVASEDLEALDAFQSLMESFAEPSAAQSDLPTIIWLKYIKADVAAELVSSVLGGGEASVASAVDGVASGFGGGMLGLLGLGGGRR